MIRRLGIVVLVLLMASFGVGVYSYLGSLKASPKVAAKAPLPSRTKPKLSLQGTMFLAQGGSLFKFQNGRFSQIATGNWSQPTITPDHTHLVAVSRSTSAADLFLLDLDGHIVRQLTRNGNRSNVSYNHWSFFPRVSPDGHTLYYSWDPKDPQNGNRVDLAIYAMPIAGSQSQARQWTAPYHYTGGDIQPLPLASGQLLYVKYDIGAQGQTYASLWLQRAPFTLTIGRAITSATDDCSQPALSPDGKMLAMICSGGQQVGRLEIASFDGTNVGPRTVLVDGQLCAAPVWSPDGRGIAYFAPVGPSGHFQLFYLPVSPAPTPTPLASASVGASASASPSARPTPAPTPTPTPMQVSEDLDFDTTASPAWY